MHVEDERIRRENNSLADSNIKSLPPNLGFWFFTIISKQTNRKLVSKVLDHLFFVRISSVESVCDGYYP